MAHTYRFFRLSFDYDAAGFIKVLMWTEALLAWFPAGDYSVKLALDGWNQYRSGAGTLSYILMAVYFLLALLMASNFYLVFISVHIACSCEALASSGDLASKIESYIKLRTAAFGNMICTPLLVFILLLLQGFIQNGGGFVQYLTGSLIGLIMVVTAWLVLSFMAWIFTRNTEELKSATSSLAMGKSSEPFN